MSSECEPGSETGAGLAKATALIVLDGGGAELSGPYASGVVPTTVPTPGRFYTIRYGQGGLLTTVGKAYSVGSGAERLRLAQRVNSHPLNRGFWVSPTSAFDRRYFPDGMISFNPIFTCDPIQRRAQRGETRCFARIYIPPRYAAMDTVYGRMISLPVLRESSEKEIGETSPIEPGLEHFFTLIECRKRSLSFDPFKAFFRRAVVEDTTRAPHRWVAGLVCFFENMKAKGSVFVPPIEGTAFFISDRYLLTAAHNLLKRVRYEDGSEHVQKPIFALITPGRNGIDVDGLRALLQPLTDEKEQFIENQRRVQCRGTNGEPGIAELFPDSDAAPDARPFGDIWLERRDDSTFRTAPEFKAPASSFDIDVRNDFGLIRLAGASIFGSRPKGFWGKGPGEFVGETMLETEVVFSDDKQPPRNIKLIGYPADKCCEQWEADGDLIGVAGDALELASLKAPPGNSGGPVFTESLVEKATGIGKQKVKLLRVVGMFVAAGATPDGKSFDGRASAVRTGLRMQRVLQGWFASDARR